MRRFPILLPLGLVLILAAACSAAPAASGPGSPAPATSPSFTVASPSPTKVVDVGVSPGTGTVYTGIFAFDDIEGGCPYLGAADGRKLQVIYPEGWSIRQAPLKLIGPDGSVRARAGDRVTVRGEEAADMASICQIGPIIRATEVLEP